MLNLAWHLFKRCECTSRRDIAALPRGDANTATARTRTLTRSERTLVSGTGKCLTPREATSSAMRLYYGAEYWGMYENYLAFE